MIPSEERRVSDLLKSVKTGSAEALEESAAPAEPNPPKDNLPDSLSSVRERVAAMPPIVLGKDMAADLGATVNSVVLVTSPQGELTPFGMVPKYIRFRVAGIFDSGFYDYDSSWGFVRLSDAQQLFGLGDVVSVLEFKIADIYREYQARLERAGAMDFDDLLTVTVRLLRQNPDVLDYYRHRFLHVMAR
jgi:lipoprotein-releasing system permease protein